MSFLSCFTLPNIHITTPVQIIREPPVLHGSVDGSVGSIEPISQDLRRMMEEMRLKIESIHARQNSDIEELQQKISYLENRIKTMGEGIYLQHHLLVNLESQQGIKKRDALGDPPAPPRGAKAESLLSPLSNIPQEISIQTNLVEKAEEVGVSPGTQITPMGVMGAMNPKGVHLSCERPRRSALAPPPLGDGSGGLIAGVVSLGSPPLGGWSRLIVEDVISMGEELQESVVVVEDTVEQTKKIIEEETRAVTNLVKDVGNIISFASKKRSGRKK